MISELAAGIGSYPPGTLAVVATAAFLAGMSRGFSGFGSALIFVPLASTAILPRMAAPLLVTMDIVLSARLVWGSYQLADKREVGTMLLGTIFGLPLGTFVLVHASPVSIRWAVGALVFAMLGVLMSGWRYKAKPKRPTTVAVGAVAGFFSGMSQTGGPPVVLYWFGGGGRPSFVRANLVFYFGASSLLSLTSYLIVGTLTMDVLGLALVAGPVYGIGLFLGMQLFGRANETVFRAIAYVLIAATGIFSLPLFDGILR